MTAVWGKISSKEIVAAVKGHLVSGEPETRFSGFNSDSRTVQRGELFWAIKGDRFDGHDFVSRAAGQGAAGVVVQEGFQVSLKTHPILPSSPLMTPSGPWGIWQPGGAGNMWPK